MMTVRQIEKLWVAKSYDRLAGELISARPEASFRLELELGRAVPAAALAVVRLEELSQSFVPLNDRLIRTLLATQDADGGWGDPMTTALVLRALLCGRGHGLAVERGMFYLANLQKQEGIWPKIPFRRLTADPFVSAFILFELGDTPQFRDAVRFLDAVNWFEAHESSLDAETRRLWDRASLRCQIHRRPEVEQLIWS